MYNHQGSERKETIGFFKGQRLIVESNRIHNRRPPAAIMEHNVLFRIMELEYAKQH